MRAATLAGLSLALIVPSSPAAASPGSPGAARLAAAIHRGYSHLLASQNPDGSWGSSASGRVLEVLAAVPGAHDAFRAGSTALCLLALHAPAAAREPCAGARRRALDFLVAHHLVRRPNGMELYNVWAFAYTLEAFAAVLRHGTAPELESRLRDASRAIIGRLGLYQTSDGGWGYYDFVAQTYRPSDSSMSFTTATVLLSLREAAAQGIEVPAGMAERAVLCLRRARKEDGAYIYGHYARLRPAAGYNEVQGSLGRTPACHLALHLQGPSTSVSGKDLRVGLENLLARHHFIDFGRKRPMPHQAWYYNSGYYFYYGHFHAARCLELLGAADQTRLLKPLEAIVLERQEADGSWWDFPLYSYYKAYGTAFALLTLSIYEEIHARLDGLDRGARREA